VRTVRHIQSSHVTLLHSQTKQLKFSRSQLLTIQSIYLNTNLCRARTVTLKSCYFFTQSDKTVDFFSSIYSIYLNANLIITHSSSQFTVTHIQHSRVTLLHSQIKQSKFSRNELLTIQSIYLNTNFNITHSGSQRTVGHIQNSHFWLSQSDKAVKVFQNTTTNNTINIHVVFFL